MYNARITRTIGKLNEIVKNSDIDNLSPKHYRADPRFWALTDTTKQKLLDNDPSLRSLGAVFYKILNSFNTKSNMSQTIGEIARAAGVNEYQARPYLKALVSEGYLRQAGSGYGMSAIGGDFGNNSLDTSKDFVP